MHRTDYNNYYNRHDHKPGRFRQQAAGSDYDYDGNDYDFDSDGSLLTLKE